MSFHDLLADLDDAAFRDLADDPAAIWTRSDGSMLTVAVMIEAGERTVTVGGLPTIMAGEVARFSAAELRRKTEAAEAPGLPLQGEVLTVNGVSYVLHGDAYYDEAIQGRDVICPMSR